MTYRDDLEALRARHAALDAQLAETTRQRDEVRRMVDQADALAKLPVLDNIRIASPCKASWDAMTGDDRARMCAQCNKQVFNLSEMTRVEAETLIADTAGKLCARYFQRADGTILLADCEVGTATRRRRHVLLASTAAVAIGAGLATATIAFTRPTATMSSIGITTDEDASAHVTVTMPDETLVPQPVQMLGQMAIRTPSVSNRHEQARVQLLRDRATRAEAAYDRAKADAAAARAAVVDAEAHAEPNR